MESKTGLWREMLYATRAIAKDGVTLTSQSMAGTTGFPVKTASAWLAILAKYGYLQRIGKQKTNGRWQYVWELTDFGRKYRPKPKEEVDEKRKRGIRLVANPRGKKKG